MQQTNQCIAFESKLDKLDSAIWHYFLRVPKSIAVQFIDGLNRRVICTLSDQLSFQCALMPDGANNYFILVNQKRRDKLGLVQGQVVKLSLEKDRSTYGVEMSAELREVFDQSDEAFQVFQSLTHGLQRSLIYWSDNVKSSEIKIRRGLVLANHLENNGVKPDFKLLNVEMKAANNASKRI